MSNIWVSQRKTLKKAMMRSAKPKPKISGSDWVNKNFYLSPESSAQAGKVHLYPYQIEMIDEMTNDTTQQVTFQKAARIGYNKMLNMAIAYFIAQNPCSILFANPSEEEAFGVASDEIEPMIRDNQLVSERVYAKTRLGKVKRDKTVKKTYAGGALELIGAFSPKGFRRRTVRVFIGDEIDAWELSAGEEGDQIALGKKRTNDFHDRKIILGSTPKLKGYSKIESEFEQGDQRYRHLPCPFCDFKQPLEFENLSWGLDDNLLLLHDSVGFICQNIECGKLITQEHHIVMDKKGKWVAKKPFHGHTSFFVWSAYSYSAGSTWIQIVKDWIEAEKNKTKLQPFINTVLGTPYEEKFDNVTVNTLMDKKEDYGDYEVPFQVVVLTCGIDTQPNRLEYTITGWGLHEEGWLVSKGVIMGDVNGLEIWDELDNFLANKTYEHINGYMKISCTTIDRGGHNTIAVDEFCKTKASRRIYPIIGAPSLNADVIKHKIPAYKASTKTKKVKHTTPFYYLGVKSIKDKMYAGITMTQQQGGANYIHFPDEEIFDNDYFNQLLSEKRDKTGRWVKKRSNIRNEMLDTLGYSYAAYRILRAKGVNVDRIAQKSEQYGLISDVSKVIKKRIKTGTLSKGVDVWN